MEKPTTNTGAYKLILETIGTQNALAKRLCVSRQLVFRWDQIPPRYLADVSAITGLPIDWVLPELETAVSALLGRPSALFLPELIRLIQGETSWQDRRKASKPARKKKK